MNRSIRIWFYLLAVYSLGMCLWFLLSGCAVRPAEESSVSRSIRRTLVQPTGKLILSWEGNQPPLPPTSYLVYYRTSIVEPWMVLTNVGQVTNLTILRNDLPNPCFFTVTASNRLGEAPTIRKANQ